MVFRAIASYKPSPSASSLVCYNVWIGTSVPEFNVTLGFDKTSMKIRFLYDSQGKRQFEQLGPNVTWESVERTIGHDRRIDFLPEVASDLYSQMLGLRLTLEKEKKIADEVKETEELFSKLISANSPNTSTA
jgi:hypothetical protein